MTGEIRKSKNMTQETVAKALGVERTTVAMWESGKSQPRAETLIKLSQLFNCTVDELLKTDPQKPQANQTKGEKTNEQQN